MDVELTARLYALELLTTQLISEYLRAVPEPVQQAEWARQHLHGRAEALRLVCDNLDEEARLRASVKEEVTRIIDTALARAQATPLRPPSWETGPQAG